MESFFFDSLILKLYYISLRCDSPNLPSRSSCCLCFLNLIIPFHSRYSQFESLSLLTQVYFGRPLTNWDGGLFTLRLIFPPTFPVEYPRIRFLTPFYHANVTPDGIPYYRVARPESCQAHIEALIDLFVKDMNPDPSCVLNRKCADLCWRRGEDGRKEFNRILRGVISRSIEFE
jgi:hypothetical protein